MTSPLCYETTCDNYRYIKVRGIVLDSRGAPVGQPVAHNKVISSTLLAGICSVSRQGKVQCNTENRPARRKSSVTSGRESVSVGVSRQSISMAAAAQMAADIAADCDTPVTVQQDYLYDWSSCKPGHRQGNVVELGDSRFSVTVPGEPVVWIFSRRAPGLAVSSVAASARSARSGSMAQMNVTAETFFSSNNSSRSDHSRSGNLLYLVEVQYYFRLDTGNVSPYMFSVNILFYHNLYGCALHHRRCSCRCPGTRTASWPARQRAWPSSPSAASWPTCSTWCTAGSATPPEQPLAPVVAA